MGNKRIIDIKEDKFDVDVLIENIIADNPDEPKDSIMDVKSEKISGNIVDE